MSAHDGRTEVIAGDVRLEVFAAGDAGAALTLCAAHPAEAFTQATAELLASTAGGARVVCVNPRGIGASQPDHALAIEAMVDDVELARTQLGLGRIVFFGMSGGGWIAQAYARRHPGALRGVIIESVCASFAVRVFDPACALSPLFPAWRPKLDELGLVPKAPANAEAVRRAQWTSVDAVGDVLREANGPALLVAPGPLPPLMRRALPAFFAFDARVWLSEIEVPALVIAGTADPIVPVAQVRAVHDALRDSRFVAIENAGHVPSAQSDARAIGAIREFLARDLRR